MVDMATIDVIFMVAALSEKLNLVLSGHGRKDVLDLWSVSHSLQYNVGCEEQKILIIYLR